MIAHTKSRSTFPWCLKLVGLVTLVGDTAAHDVLKFSPMPPTPTPATPIPATPSPHHDNLESAAGEKEEHEHESAHHHEHHHEHHHGHHHHKPSNSENVMAVMTLGAVAFQMSMFYIVNHRDDDLRRYSVSVIGETISIFCSITIVTAIFSFLERFLDHTDSFMYVTSTLALCVLCFILLEVWVLVAARVRGDKAETKATIGVSKDKSKRQQLDIPEYELNARTFGAAAAQMTAAVAMRGFGNLQFLATIRRSPLMVALVCPVAFTSLFMLVYLTALLRKAIIQLDSDVDEAEEIWIKVAEECEDEVISLTFSFHAAVAFRVAITDSLPHMLLHGYAHPHELEIANIRSIIVLLGSGFGCACLCVVLNFVLFGRVSAHVNMTKLRTDTFSRVVRLFTKSIGLVCTWCICFGAHLFALNLTNQHEGLAVRLILSLLMSFGCFVVVVILDFVADFSKKTNCAGPAIDRAIVMIIFALGAAVGLTWEQCFHTCVDIVVEYMVEDESNPIFALTSDRSIWALFLSILIVLTVFPAYRLYIVPRREQMMEEHEHEMHAREQEYLATDGGYRRATQLNEELFEFGYNNNQLETEMVNQEKGGH